MFNALAGEAMTSNTKPDLIQTLSRLPLVALWNWLNLLVFNLTNQRLPNSILEDAHNKPWRPLPANRLTPEVATRFLLATVPCSLLALYFLGGFMESMWMVILTWMYNDLGGADISYITRNLINAAGFICYARGSTLVAAGGDHQLSDGAHGWIFIIGAIIFTTLQMQDLADMKGDAARGRRTLPLVHGERIGRLSIAIPVALWSFICPAFWKTNIWCYLPTAVIGLTVTSRVLTTHDVSGDKTTWRLWCFWIICIYLIPLLKHHEIFTRFWVDVVT